MSDTTWFKPVCDIILYRFISIRDSYTKGDVYASKPFLSKDGRLEDKPTIYLHKIVLNEFEAKHLVRILKAVIPKREVTKQMIEVEKGIKNKVGKLIPPNYYEIKLALYKSQIHEICEALMKAKSGMLKDISEVIADQKEKAPFEL